MARNALPRWEIAFFSSALSSAQAPVVVETPGGLAGQTADLEWVRQQLA